MTNRAKRNFLFIGILTSEICACLGFETKHSNLLGWTLLFAGAGLTAVGCLYLGGLSLVPEEERLARDRSLWLPCIGALLISLVTPLEYLYLPEVLPRSDAFQDIGIILSIGGLAFYLLSLRSPHPWQAQGSRRFSAVLRRMALNPISAGLLLFLFALGIGYSSLIGLALLVLLVLPGVYKMTR
jgi:hypothetical protein